MPLQYRALYYESRTLTNISDPGSDLADASAS